MTAREPDPGERLVVVRLTQIPRTVRVAAAHRVIREERLEGERAGEMLVAALVPQRDPHRLVSPEVARSVGVEVS